jgi:Tfp pilus assembly protein PilF
MKKLSTALGAMVFVFVLFWAATSAWAGQQTRASSPQLSKHQEKAKADIKLGDVALKNHAMREAIADYKAAVLADPDNPGAHRKFIRTSIFSVDLLRPQKKGTKSRKNGKKLTKEQQQAQASKADAEQKRLEAKWGKEHANVEAQLLATYDKWIKKNPQNAMFYWGKGEVYAFSSKDEQAPRLWFRKAIAINPSCAPAWASLSTGAYLDGNVSEQRQDAEKALALDPQDRYGVFFLYALSYFSTDPAKFNTIVEDRVTKDPGDQNLETLLMLVAENAPTPAEQQAAYEKIYQLYAPQSAHPSNSLDEIMPQLFNLYARSDASKALTFAEKMESDEAAAQAKKAASEKASAATSRSKTDAKRQKPFWQTIVDYQKSIIDAQSFITQKKYSDALNLLAKNDLKPANDYDPLGQIDRTPYQLTKAEAFAASGQTQKAYDSIKTALLPQPDDSLDAALVSYGAKLGKTPAQVREDLWQTRDATAKPFTPFDLKQYVTNKDVKLADFRGHVVLVNFWYPG